MFTPTVTELHRHLEAISRDTFIDAGLRTPAPRPPAPSNVIELRPAASSALGIGRAAA